MSDPKIAPREVRHAAVMKYDKRIQETGTSDRVVSITVDTLVELTRNDSVVQHGEHRLKTWPEPFNAVCNGQKTHEARTNDRGFKVGDTLHLHEWYPDTKEYSGRWTAVRVNYITEGGQFGLPENLCVMSIGPTNKTR